MNLFDAFTKLDRLSESIEPCWFGSYLDRNNDKKIIYATKASTSYDAEEGADILEDIIPEPYTKFIFRGSIDSTLAEKEGYLLVEGIFDTMPTLNHWKTTSGQQINTNTKSSASSQTSPISAKARATGQPNIVTIVYDNLKQKLRAQADDGVHGIANVAFPNSLRNKEGQQYEVEILTWNGKNYRASGNIKPVNSIANTQNINNNIKENIEMNFQNILEELDRLYEGAQEESIEEGIFDVFKNKKAGSDEVPQKRSNLYVILVTAKEGKNAGKWTYTATQPSDSSKVASMQATVDDQNRKQDKYQYKVVNYSQAKNIVGRAWDGSKEMVWHKMFEGVEVDQEAIVEDADEEVLVDNEPIIDDETEAKETAEAEEVEETDEATKQVVLECSNCGALVIKEESDIKVDEETDLVNVEEECKFCEEADGYKIIGSLVSYEGAEEVTESLTEGKIKDSLKKLGTRLGADATSVIRGLSEIIPGDLYQALEYVENKAVLKALQNGNEKVLNGTTIEDLEELKKDIEEYKNRNKNKDVESDSDDELDEGIFSGFGGNNKPKTIRVDNPEFSAKVARELKSKFGGEVKTFELTSGDEASVWVDTKKKFNAASKYMGKKYPSVSFTTDEYDLVRNK